MASSTPFDGTVFLTGAPDEDQPHGNDYLEHQNTRKSMEFINNKEHEDLANPMSTSVGGGEHSNGSSVAYFTSTAPTLRPDGITALADNAIDKGRMWFDSTFDPPVMKKWNGSAWVQAGNKVLNDTFYTGVDKAGTGSADLIKVGRNVADDADVPFIADKARLASNAPPGEDTDIPNKKYVDDQNTAQMTPASYAGEEVVVFANGLILKTGVKSVGANATALVTFDVGQTAFSTLKTILLTIEFSAASGGNAGTAFIKTKSTTAFTILNSEDSTVSVHWQAWGV